MSKARAQPRRCTPSPHPAPPASSRGPQGSPDPRIPLWKEQHVTSSRGSEPGCPESFRPWACHTAEGSKSETEAAAAQPSVPAPFADLEKRVHSPLASGVCQRPEPDADREEPEAMAAQPGFSIRGAQNPSQESSPGWEETMAGPEASPSPDVRVGIVKRMVARPSTDSRTRACFQSLGEGGEVCSSRDERSWQLLREAL